MTRDQIAANVMNNLNDLKLSFFSAANINNSIQDGYDEISAFCQQIDGSTTIDITANKSYYDLSVLIPNFLSLVHVYNVNMKYWLFPSNKLVLGQMRWDWENWIGEPRYFFPHSWNLLCVSPKKRESNGQLLIMHRCMADTLTGASVPKIHTNYMKLPELYATYDLLTQAREYTKAKIWYNEYLTMLKAYRIDTKSLAATDMIATMRG